MPLKELSPFISDDDVFSNYSLELIQEVTSKFCDGGF
jgi:hypothetical protein